MVVELRGKIDGKEILFERVSQDEWRAAIPREFCGFYIVELEAFDEAGNRAYITKFLLTVDLDSLGVKLVPCSYQAGLLPSEFEGEPYHSSYIAYLELEDGEDYDHDYGIGRNKACQAQN